MSGSCSGCWGFGPCVDPDAHRAPATRVMGPVEAELRILGDGLVADPVSAMYQNSWLNVSEKALDLCFEVAPTFGTSVLGTVVMPDILSEAIEAAEALGL